MTENVPKLRRLLNEAMERIRELEAEKLTPAPGPERVVYSDNPDLLETIKKLQEQICLSTSQ